MDGNSTWHTSHFSRIDDVQQQNWWRATLQRSNPLPDLVPLHGFQSRLGSAPYIQYWPRHLLCFLKMLDFSRPTLGSRADVLDKQGIWCNAEIIGGTTDVYVRVRFIYWPGEDEDTEDEWPNRVAPPGTQATDNMLQFMSINTGEFWVRRPSTRLKSCRWITRIEGFFPIGKWC